METDEKARGYSWAYTINNYTEEDIQLLKKIPKEQVQYHICGKEVGEEGTPHLQGFIIFHNQKTFKQVKVHMPRAHLSKKYKKSTVQHNIDYCGKEEIFIQEGEPPKGQGSRTDLARMKELVKKTPDQST